MELTKWTIGVVKLLCLPIVSSIAALIAIFYDLPLAMVKDHSCVGEGFAEWFFDLKKEESEGE